MEKFWEKYISKMTLNSAKRQDWDSVGLDNYILDFKKGDFVVVESNAYVYYKSETLQEAIQNLKATISEYQLKLDWDNSEIDLLNLINWKEWLRTKHIEFDIIEIV